MPGPIGWYFLFFMVALVPWAAFRTTTWFEAGPVPPRICVMTSTLIQMACFGGFAWWCSSARMPCTT